MSTDMFGLARSVFKQIDLTIGEYDGSARDGELIVDLNPGPGQYKLYIGQANGAISFANTGVTSVDIISNNFSITGSPITGGDGVISINIPGRTITTASTSRVTLFAALINGPTGYEFLIKGVDINTGQMNMERLTVISSNGNCNFSRFGQVDLGQILGAPDATMIGTTLEIGITPTTSDPIAWTIQYQKI